MTSDLCRGWSRVYSSKRVCAIDLGRIGLITILEQDEVLESDFETRDGILSTSASVEAAVLEQAGFVEIERASVN